MFFARSSVLGHRLLYRHPLNIRDEADTRKYYVVAPVCLQRSDDMAIRSHATLCFSADASIKVSAGVVWTRSVESTSMLM